MKDEIWAQRLSWAVHVVRVHFMQLGCSQGSCSWVHEVDKSSNRMIFQSQRQAKQQGRDHLSTRKYNTIKQIVGPMTEQSRRDDERPFPQKGIEQIIKKKKKKTFGFLTIFFNVQYFQDVYHDSACDYVLILIASAY